MLLSLPQRFCFEIDPSNSNFTSQNSPFAIQTIESLPESILFSYQPKSGKVTNLRSRFKTKYKGTVSKPKRLNKLHKHTSAYVTFASQIIKNHNTQNYRSQSPFFPTNFQQPNELQ